MRRPGLLLLALGVALPALALLGALSPLAPSASSAQWASQAPAAKLAVAQPLVLGPEAAKNVILLIGDGMGFAHVRLAELVFGRLNMTFIRDTGVELTDSLSGEVPDSAAAGSMIATGIKTYNGVISMAPVEGPAGTSLAPVMSLLEVAQRLGKSVGLATTTSITDATPAVFASHVPDRSMQTAIAQQLVDRGVDVLLGGGRKYFSADLIERARSKGYSVVFSRQELLGLAKPSKVLGLFADEDLPYSIDRGPDVPSLPEMFQAALRVLEANPNGFFLMVEGGRIDHASHINDAAALAWDLKEFDDVVGLALSYAMSRNDTLVVVLADHETGGLAVGGFAYGRAVNLTALLRVRASAEKMASEIKAGADANQTIYRYTGIVLAEADLELVRAKPSPDVIGWIVSKYLGVSWASTKHTGAPVPLMALGPGSQLFRGTHHHTDTCKLIATLMLFGAAPQALALNPAASPVRGDLNGDGAVDAKDAYLALWLLLGSRADDLLKKSSDLNRNGVVDLEDVLLMYLGQA